MTRPTRNRLAALQQHRNEQCRSAWEQYRTHRDRITRIVLQEAARTGRSDLCVLGAGNCNDIDLQTLLAAGLRVHLVDLDSTALEAGLKQQAVPDDACIARHGGVDLTGMFDEISALNTDSDIELVREIAQRLPTARPFAELPTGNMVLSIGLLTQLVEAATLTIGTEHAGFLELTQALRLQHLRLAVDLVVPGGSVIITSEIVSSDTAPHIVSLREDQLPSALSLLLLQGNFFSGLHPGIVGSTLQSDPVTGPQLNGLRVEGPWLWQFVARTYAVCGFVGVKTMMQRSS